MHMYNVQHGIFKHFSPREDENSGIKTAKELFEELKARAEKVETCIAGIETRIDQVLNRIHVLELGKIRTLKGLKKIVTRMKKVRRESCLEEGAYVCFLCRNLASRMKLS